MSPVTLFATTLVCGATGDQRQDSLGLPGVRRRLDVDHVVKRSQGGSDFDLDLLVALCRWCHDQTDAPYERGRLVVTALGAGQFRFDVIRRVARGRAPVDEHEVCPRGQNDPALIGTQSVIPFASLHLNVSDIHDAHAD
jgi:hypothetical protein